MKKKLLILLSALTLLLAGCGQKQGSQKLQIVAAIFPEYDWVRQIVGDDDSVELTLLVDDAELAARQPHIPDLSASRVGTGREMFGALREKLSGAEQGATCITF